MAWWLAGILVLVLLALSPLLSLFLGGRLFFPRFTLGLLRHSLSLIDKLADRIRPGLALELLTQGVNRYFAAKFAATPFASRMLFLPFCLKPPYCQAEVDRESGMLCSSQCPDCVLGQVRQEAYALGYGQVFVVPSSRILPKAGLMPSSEFMKQKIKEHKPAAALGIVCAWHLRTRILPKHTAGAKGYAPKGQPSTGAIPQAVLMPVRNCFKATVDWAKVRQLMNMR